DVPVRPRGGGPVTEPSIGRPDAVRVHPGDSVAVAVRPLAAGETVAVEGERLVVGDDVPAGHKLALRAHDEGEPVTKYGFPIGRASTRIARGAWVHAHNLRTALEGTLDYAYAPASLARETPAAVPTFAGYRRASGKVGTRNEVWVVNTVGCVNFAAEAIARASNERFADAIDGVHAFGHPFGCSQLGDDLKNTQRVLAGLMRHPNAGGVLVLGLGCENNQLDQLLALAGDDLDRSRLRYFNTQDVMDEREQGLEAVAELVARMRDDRRTEEPVSSLVLGHKCGGSDGFSGITANPLVGRIADRLAGHGGGVLLTEVPEMFGAEQVLMNRATTEPVFQDLVRMINDFKQYFLRHDQPVYENPSPGNKAGGLTTLEEKSLGAIQKGGRAPVTRVLRYGQPAGPGGLSLLEAPGNDGVSSTAMTASGATMLLFTTGRGTPLGFPVPTLKISSNSDIAQRKPHWIDFDAGRLLTGERTMDALADELFALVLEVASGRVRTNNERNGNREIAIWKSGVTL
ncbi:MAG TPA: altronate dehydratase family protein, partial [Gemmatimonadaceae bacterium]|nr:altronate dehydratase family protein [Gemmatimonadaceae bacterium]